MLYSKNGSIPKPETDGTDGWYIIQDPPEVPEGKELVWWFPPGWVIRDPKPSATETTDWSWSQSEGRWVEYSTETVIIQPEVTSSSSAGIYIDASSATNTIDLGSATGV